MLLQSTAISVVAVAVATIEDINRWSSKTIDLIVRSGIRLYNDARLIHKISEIDLCHLPRKLFIGEVGVDISILSPTLTELCVASLVEFFEQHTAAYMVLNGSKCVSIIRVFNQFFLFDPMLCTRSGVLAKPNAGGAVCVVRFKNFQKLIEHLTKNIECSSIGDGNIKLILGAIKCQRAV